MITRSSLHASPLVALLFFAGCSPDLSLLSDQASFAGVGGGGTSGTSSAGTAGASDVADNAGSANGANGGVGSGGSPNGGGAGVAGSFSTGGSAPAGGEGGEQAAGAGASNNVLLPDAGAAGAGGEPSVVPGIDETFEKDLPLLGDSTGGSPFADDCNDGEALAGVTVTTGAFLSQIRGICRSISLVASSSAAHGYQVKLAPARALPAHPTTSTDTAASMLCPEDTALVGVRLAQQNYDLGDNQSLPVIVRIWVSCAKLVLVDRQGGLGIGWQGPKELAPQSGSYANGTAWLVSSTAPDGSLASRLLGASGAWVDRVGFGVSHFDLVLP